MLRFAPFLVGLGFLAVAGYSLAAVVGSGNESRSVALKPYSDPWLAARQRFMDMDDRPFGERFNTDFTYAGKSVILTYETRPTGKIFRGHLKLTGLKPNFVYQLKLAGKPIYGSRGWGRSGDDFANAAIGKVGRWWDDSTQQNAADAQFMALYNHATPARLHTVYSYLFMGDVITDANGNFEGDFSSAHSYHVTWQDKQEYGIRQAVQGTFAVHSSPEPLYAYDTPLENHPVKLWYEWQSDRPHDVRLPTGHYNCRFLITEESFHNNFVGVYPANPLGGMYKTVLCNEDFLGDGRPDTDATNDIKFDIF